MNLASPYLDEEQTVVGHDASKGEDLSGEEVRGGQNGLVGPDELGPGRALSPLGYGIKAMALEDVAHGLIGKADPKIGQGS